MAHTTKLELRRRLRRHIGEPYASGVSSLNGFWLDSELNEDLDYAMRRLAVDTITPDGYALMRRIYEVRGRYGVGKYQLPEDVIEILHVEVDSGSTPLVIPQASSVSQLTYGVTRGSTASIPFGWTMFGQDRFLISDGIATSGTVTTLEDSNRTGDAVYGFAVGTSVVDDDGNALATSDFVENVTAGWVAQISTITDSDTLTLAAQTQTTGMRGGRPNVELGDYYKIWSGEYSRPVLWIAYPKSGNDEEETESHTSGTNADVTVGTNSSGTNVLQSQSFVIDRDSELSSVSVYLTADTGTPRGNLVCRIETNNAGVPSATLVNYRAVASIAEEDIVQNSWNTFYFRDPFRLAAATTYHATFQLPAQTNYYSSASSNFYAFRSDSAGGYAQGNRSENTGSWAAQAGSDLLFKVNTVTQPETIRVHYVPHPSALDVDGAILDLPMMAEDAVLWYAGMLAMEKKGDSGMRMRQEFERRYYQELDKLRTNVRQQGTRGYDTVKDAMWGSLGIPTVRTAMPDRYSRFTFDGDIS